jgi:hypothetical protein
LAEEAIEGWLTETYDYERPRRGQVREGVILRIEKRGVIVDVGLKREGIVPQRTSNVWGGCVVICRCPISWGGGKIGGIDCSSRGIASGETKTM